MYIARYLGARGYLGFADEGIYAIITMQEGEYGN